MPIHKVDEKAVHPRIGEHGTTVPVRVLADSGVTSRVQIEGCGVLLRQGAVHTVPSSTVQQGGGR